MHTKGARFWRRMPLITLAVICLGLTLTESVNATIIPTLSIGSHGSGVVELQQRLKFLGYYRGTTDGGFGWKTYWDVRNFQSAFGLKVDGLVGNQTISMLDRATVAWKPSSNLGGTTGIPAFAATPAPAVSSGTTSMGISQNDIQLMAHVVYGEARNQPFVGQVAVAAVILNRYHSSSFPHSIPTLIYQPGAFTSLTNGQASGIDAQAISAVMDAAHGWDPTHGALYYWNPATATSPWVWSQPIMLRIGNHVFAK